MNPRERELFLEGMNDALSDPALLMTEGRSHKKAKTRAINALSPPTDLPQASASR